MMSLRDAATRIADEIDNMRKVFGAPGDHGYNTAEGQALYGLYMAWAKLKQVLTGATPADGVMPISIEIETTRSGYREGHFRDVHGDPCTIGKSSEAWDSTVGLGLDVSAPMCLTREQVAGLLPHLQKFVAEGEL